MAKNDENKPPAPAANEAKPASNDPKPPDSPTPDAPAGASAAVDGASDPGSGQPPAPIKSKPKYPLEIAPGRAIYGGARGTHLNQGDEVLKTDFDADTLALLISNGVVRDNRKQ